MRLNNKNSFLPLKPYVWIIFFVTIINGQTINIPSDYTTIQAGLNAANEGDTVLVQPGTYTENIIWPETNGIKLISAGDSSNTKIDGGGTSSVIYMNPSSATIDTTTLIQGFTITNGGNVINGGGMYINNCGPIIKNSSIFENATLASTTVDQGSDEIGDGGGGIFITNSKKLQIVGCSILNNSCGKNGVGAGIKITASNSIIIKNCRISNNSSEGYNAHGGGFYLRSSSFTLNDCTIKNNYAQNRGGGLYIKNCDKNVILEDLSINNNLSQTGGGLYFHQSKGTANNIDVYSNSSSAHAAGIACYASSPSISNSSIRYNNAGQNGGGIWALDGSKPILNNLIISNNKAGYGGGGTYGSVQISNSFIEGNSAGDSHPQEEYRSGGGMNGFSSIENCKIINNYSGNGGGVAYGDTIKNTLIMNNNSKNYGASVYIVGNIYTSTIINNNSSLNYNGLYGKCSITKSNISNNGNAHFNNDPSSIPNAINNYWGHSSGPYHPSQNTSGKGDSVNAYVNVTPWLANPNTDAPPIPPQNLKLENQYAWSDNFSKGEFKWDESEIGDKSGYKIYLDSDTSGYPYAESIDLGDSLNYIHSYLKIGKTYYVAVTVYDTEGNESWYSNEVSIRVNNPPVLVQLQLDLGWHEDEVGHVKLSASDVDGDSLTFSGFADTSAISVGASNDTLILTPQPDWWGGSNVTAIVSDGIQSDSMTFHVDFISKNDPPTQFDWVSNALDTLYINGSNLDNKYTLQWRKSTDADGDSINYLIYAQIGKMPVKMIHDTTDTVYAISYQKLIDEVFDDFPMLPKATVRFSVSATDVIDTVKVTGDDRVLFINRYDYLSTDEINMPTEFALHENYPNPFNPRTTIRFDLPVETHGHVSLHIFNVNGQLVKTFNINDTPAGYHSIKWDATNDYGEPVGAGVYLYQLRAKGFVKTRKMVLLK